MSEVQAVYERIKVRRSEHETSKIHDDTQFSTKHFFYSWTLNNFIECTKFSEIKFCSPAFEFAGAAWGLTLRSKYKNDKLDNVNIRLRVGKGLYGKGYSEHYIQYKFSLLNADGSLVSKTAGSESSGIARDHGLSFKYHEQNENGSSFIINDKVTVHCDLLILTLVSTDQVLSSCSQTNQPNNAVQRPLHETSEIHDDTQLSTKHFFYIWTLNNFLECTKFPKMKILGPRFEFAGAKWRLRLYKNDKLDNVEIRLVRVGEYYSGHYMYYKFSLLIADGSLVSKNAASDFSETVWGQGLSFKYHEQNENGSSFIINDKVTVHCNLLILATRASTDQVPSLRSQMNQPNKAVQRPFYKTAICPSPIQFQQITRVPKSVNNPKSAARTPHSLVQKSTNNPKSAARTARMEDFSQWKRIDFFRIIACIIISCLIFFGTETIFPKQNSMNGKLNMTEIHELIVDSTLKIQTIAEAFNLTSVKIKSAELLAWYHGNIISNGKYAGSRMKTLLRVIFDQLLLNASSGKNETTVVNVTSTEHANDNEKLTEH